MGKCQDARALWEQCLERDGPKHDGMFNGIMYLGKDGQDALNNLDDWFEMEVTVDSGACDTVMPANMAEHIKVVQSPGSMRKQEWEAANGSTISNLGERRCMINTEGGGRDRLMHFQVADIKKPLLSITRTADMGYECVLGAKGGYLLDTHTNDRIPIARRGNLYVMKIWVKDADKAKAAQGFGRQD